MALQSHLVELERKHKILENELHDALVHLSTDDLRIVELKRRKLMVKDQIERLRQSTAFSAQHRERNFVARRVLARSFAGRGCLQIAGGAFYRSASLPTCSAMASDDVKPGDSMPNRLISPATPWSAGPAIRKSCVATAGGTILGRIPE